MHMSMCIFVIWKMQKASTNWVVSSQASGMSQKSVYCLLQWHLVTHLSVWGHSHLWMPAVPDRLRLKAHSSSVSLTSVCGLSACYSVVWIKMKSEAPARCPFFHPVYLYTVMCDASRHDAVGLSMSCYRSSDWHYCVYAKSWTLAKWNLRITRPSLKQSPSHKLPVYSMKTKIIFFRTIKL